jgi:hypothetical protein
LIEALEADAFRYEAEVEHTQFFALAQAGPAVDGETGLGCDEDLQ